MQQSAPHPIRDPAANLSDIFGPDGRLAERLPGFSYRASQQRMAECVQAALASGRHAVLEAGTGIGKTYAYLIPVLLSGQHAIISTGTRTLQDQLHARDLPMLGAVLGRPVKVALLKGRANYLCQHRFALAREDARALRWPGALAALDEWARVTDSGDLTELDALPEEPSLHALVTSTVDNCLGTRCAHYDRCFVLSARRRAQAAQVVIVNHHLLLADLALRESGFGELLPGADAVVVDEAHLLPEIAQQFFGVALGSREIGRLARDSAVEAEAAGIGAGLAPLLEALDRDARMAEDLAGDESARVPWPGVPRALTDRLLSWREPLAALAAALELSADASAGLARCRERAVDALARLQRIAEADAGEGLRWVDMARRAVTAHFTPADTGAALGARIDTQGGHWIFTSATLAVGEDFTHFASRVGVSDAIEAVLESPFDYERSARLYLPQGLPEPAREDHVDALLGAAWPLVEAAGGGAFFLFTSYRALHRAQRWLLDRPVPWPLLVQGSGARSELLERFREAGDAVLLGTGSFWQGVDVRGPALRVVVIDKLPFASPGDPLVRARLDAIRRAGGDPFGAFQLPQAVLALKQGVGRLIRDFDDRGLIVIGDPRLRTRPYGRVFLASLPRMPQLEEPRDALAFATGLRPVPEPAAGAGVRA
jgi:ATP-dependent DNA helicase DinG